MSDQTQAAAMGVVPGAPQQDAGLGGQLQGLLNARSHIDNQIATTLPQALQPVKTPGITQGHLPGAFEFTVNQPKFAAPQGHKDAVAQGVAKTISGVAGIVSAAVNAKKQAGQRQLAGEINKVMTAQAGISDATSRLQSNPDDKDAKDIVTKNKQIINDTIGADPKKLKQFEKAFDINFLDPSKNDKDEHGALKLATKTYADQLAEKTPEKMQPNQVAQQKLQILGAQGAALDAQVKALMPAYVQQQRDTAAADRVNTQQANANARTDATNRTHAAIAQAQIEEHAKEANLRFQEVKATNSTRYGVAALQAKSAMERVQIQVTSRQKIADGIRQSKPSVAGKLDEQNAALIQKQMNQIPQQIANIESIRKNADKSQVDGYNKTIQYLEAQQKQYSAMLSQYAKENMNMPPEQKGDADANERTGTSKPSDEPIRTSSVGDFADDTSDGDPTDPDSNYYN